jgi:hypothetical protein
MSSILDNRCCSEAVPRNFLYKFLVISRAMETLHFRTPLWSEADEGALEISDCPKYNVRGDILAKCREEPLRAATPLALNVCGLK